MSLLPLLYRDLYDFDPRPTRILDQHFGLGLVPEDLLSPLTEPAAVRALLRGSGYYRPWRTASSGQDTGSTVVTDKDKFQVTLDVQQFTPQDITVKACDGNVITVEGRHEEKQDEHGFVSRHFVRKYVLPKGHDIDGVSSTLSSDGVLTITAPKKAIEGGESRSIQITHTGPSKPVEGKASGDK